MTNTCLTLRGLALSISLAVQLVQVSSLSGQETLQPTSLGKLQVFDAGYNYALRAGDLNADGRAEFLVYPYHAGTMQVVSLRPARGLDFGPVEQVGEILDLAIGRLSPCDPQNSLVILGGGGSVKIYILQAGRLQLRQSFSVGAGIQVRLADLDRDGTPEILVLNPGDLTTSRPTTLSIFTRTGTNYTKTASPVLGMEVQSFSVWDINADGRSDVLYASDFLSPNCRALLNTPGGLVGTNLFDIGNHQDVDAPDIDGDGRPDLLASRPIPVIGP